MPPCVHPTAIQRRHIAFGVILFFFSVALMIAEAKRPSSAHSGYWVGAVGLLPTAFALACGLKESRVLLIVACTCDFLSALTCVGGAVISLIFFSVHVYAVGWLSVILTTFLLYHAFAIFGELNICCRMATFELSESNTEEAGHRHRSLDIPAPPIGFIMPDEIPKPPNYDQLSIRGEPPAYEDARSLFSLQPPATPQPAVRFARQYRINGELPLRLASPLQRPRSHSRPRNRSHEGHPRSHSAQRHEGAREAEEGSTTGM